MAEATKHFWAHINDRTLKEVQSIITDGEVMTDGDCGNVWGEKHYCPWPHILIKHPSDEDLAALRANGTGYIINDTDVWADVTDSWNWKEDPNCRLREYYSFDYRKPHGEEIPVILGPRTERECVEELESFRKNLPRRPKNLPI